MTITAPETGTSQVASQPVYTLVIVQSSASGQILHVVVQPEAGHAPFLGEQFLSAPPQFDVLTPSDSDTRILTAGALEIMDHAAAAGPLREDFSAFLDDDD
jgi:hypothetical protein